MRSTLTLRRAVLSILASAAALLALAPAPPAAASGKQVSLFQDDDALLSNPAQSLQELRHLGVGMVRVNVRWSFIAPDPTSMTKPSFNAADPNAYPAGAWDPYDAIVQDARADGIQVMFNPTAFAPLWAQGAHASKFGAQYNDEFAFMPSANEFKLFVEAVGKRYPSVRTWELYNEPNFGEDLAPQAIEGSRVLYAPVMYRSLVGAAWSALQATGHRRNTLIIGALAAHGAHVPSRRNLGLPGAYGETPPLQFIRDLYCLDNNYKPFRGAAAKVRNCPRTAAASRRFRRQNPALFNATAFSDHPYPLGRDGSTPPTSTHYRNKDFAGFSQLPNMMKVLDRAQQAYGARKHFSIWNTEYGYVTNPPNQSEHFASLTTQALFDNWAEYLSWKNGRISSGMQFLLYDPNPTVGEPECGGFASGLVFFPDAPTGPGCSSYPPGATKPGLDAYRLPIFLPKSSGRRGHKLTVWGCVRPAHYALLDTHQPQTAQIQFERGSSGVWSTIATVTFKNPNSSCYFTRNIKFPASGSVRLAYSYPAGDSGLAATIPVDGSPSVSRSASVKIR